jgi:cell wall-associated NlpC family hydrolase
MRKVIITASMLLTASCAASAASARPVVDAPPEVTRQVTVGLLSGQEPVMTLLGQQYVANSTAALNRKKIAAVVKRLEKRIGKTRYVFSGSTPSGWDCSGMTRWVYGQLGVEIPHSATKQYGAGRVVKEPEVGDIVLFGYKGSKSYYHAALYVGSGNVIHAGFRRGTVTERIAVLSPAFKDSRITFVRVLDLGT